MQQREIFPYYRKCCSEMAKNYDIIQGYFTDGFAEELCKYRGYVGEEQYREIVERNLGYCSILPSMLDESARELGLVTKSNEYILENRFVIPVDDVAGNLVALIGYYPDVKKYITTPSPFFSKEVLFYNFKQAYDLAYKEYGGRVILVEGIFDCISISSLGLPCIATMGANVGTLKGELLKLFRKVVGIPDNDETGRKSLNRFDTKRGWKVPYGSTLVKISGTYDFGDGDKRVIKDCDNIVSWFDADSVREMFIGLFDEKDELVTLSL